MIASAPAPTLNALPTASITAGRRHYFTFLCVCLFGYALFGKTFAYVGIPPLFIGEVALLLGAIICFFTPGTRRLLQVRAVWPLLALIGWGIIRTLPYVSDDGINALRDAMVYAYGLFALLMCSLIQDQPQRIGLLLRRYAAFIPVFVGLVPFLAVAHRFLTPMPSLPWADVKLISMKESDVMVHLGGVLAFWMIGFAGNVSWKWLVLMLAGVGITGVVDRSGLVAYLFVAIVGFCLRPRSVVPRRMLALLSLGIVLLWITQFRFEIPDGKGREISLDQFAANLTSVAGDSGSNSLDSTREWRVDWWNDIVNYTIHGPYRWTGKGFGINLADDDGYRLDEDGTLRSPHSVHMTFLARAGVPGLALWILTQLAWAVGIVNRYVRAASERDLRWQGVFLFLGCYWGAFIINASFDVFLEGPMGGIWFWCIFGTGLGAMWVHDSCPRTLADSLSGTTAQAQVVV